MHNKYIRIKNLLDRGAAFILLICLAPVFGLITLLIKIDSRGPVLFRQKRYGVNKTFFNILKFRTMRVEAPKDCPTHLLSNSHQYITKVGKILRKTSLDELPQLINICLGQMSFVGPRPALWNQDDLIELRDKCYANDVKPGITGWAQINGRDEIPLEKKVEYDGVYVQRMSFLFDLKCIIGTILTVVFQHGFKEGNTSDE